MERELAAVAWRRRGQGGRGRPEREQGVRGGVGCGSGASGSEAEEGERKEGERKEKGKREKGKRNGKKEKEIEEKKNGREGKEKEGGGRCAPAATAAAVGHAWRAGRGRWGTRSEEREEKGEGKRRGGIRGGQSRRVALDGKGWDAD